MSHNVRCPGTLVANSECGSCFPQLNGYNIQWTLKRMIIKSTGSMVYQLLTEIEEGGRKAQKYFLIKKREREIDLFVLER